MAEQLGRDLELMREEAAPQGLPQFAVMLPRPGMAPLFVQAAAMEPAYRALRCKGAQRGHGPTFFAPPTAQEEWLAVDALLEVMEEH